MDSRGIVVGALDVPAVAFVGPAGLVELPDAGLTIDWSIHTDAWRAPSATAIRQQAVDGMPVVETRVSARGGDVVHRAYAVIGPPPALMIVVENASPEPIAVRLQVRATGRVAASELVRAATAWREVEHDGDCTSLVWPLPHRASVRVAVPLDGRAPDPGALDPRAQPSADDVARGWTALLARGARLDADDETLRRAVDGARAALLLLAGRHRPRPSAGEVIALEDWGFDREAVAAWSRLSIRDRRRAGRRTSVAEPWTAVRTELAGAPAGVPANPARFLSALRDVVIADERDHSIALFPGYPAEWLGRAVAVHDLPTRDGVVSCAVRWHGARPALLWSAPPGVTVRAPSLDAAWTSDAAEGEALLASPSDQLLKLATATREGDAVEDPGSFT